MEPQPVVPIDYFQETRNPWPQLLRTLGVLALVLGVCYMGIAVMQLWMFSPTMPARDRSQLWMVRGIEFLVGIVLMIGALVMIKKRRSNALLMIGAWGAIALWVGQIILAYVSWGRLPSPSMMINGLLYVAMNCIFPLMIVMLLWQYRKEGSPSPRQQP